MRATELQMFDLCPQYYFSAQDREKSEPNKYALIGTNIHHLIETVIKAEKYDDVDFIRDLASEIGITPDQVLKTVQYCRRLRGIVGHEFNLEYYMEYPAYNLTGTCDILTVDDDGVYHIIDHKTIRKSKSVEYWRKQLQPQVYAFLVSKLFSQDQIRLSFGHVFLNTIYTFEYNKTDLELIEHKIKNLIKDMLYIQQFNLDVRNPNENCKYCAVKDTCVLSSVHDNAFSDILAYRFANKTTKLAVLEANKERIDEEIAKLLEDS